MKKDTHARIARLLYSIFAMLKCIQQYKEYIDQDPVYSITGQLKHDFNSLIATSQRFMRSIAYIIPKEEMQLWNADWQRDYMNIASVFELWAGMDDEGRERLETYAENLCKENVYVKSLPFVKFECIEGLQPGDQCLIVVKDTIIHTTYHNNKIGFYSLINSQYYLPCSNTLIYKI